MYGRVQAGIIADKAPHRKGRATLRRIMEVFDFDEPRCAAAAAPTTTPDCSFLFSRCADCNPRYSAEERLAEERLAAAKTSQKSHFVRQRRRRQPPPLPPPPRGQDRGPIASLPSSSTAWRRTAGPEYEPAPSLPARAAKWTDGTGLLWEVRPIAITD